MAMEMQHIPVLLNEVIQYLNCRQGGIYIDGTLGRGGHTEAILKKIGAQGQVLGLDRDQTAIDYVRKKLGHDHRLVLRHSNFTEIPEILTELGIEAVDGMLFDLGVSSPQLDQPARGFSYQHEAPLDMRMDREQLRTAADIVNKYSRQELAGIIKDYGEEKWASRIAKFIVDFRRRKPIETTTALVEIIKAAIPAAARRKGGHPARRTFQALRIATNNELVQLRLLIDQAVTHLKDGGRLCIISFHSLEDRIVKNGFRELARSCLCPDELPVCICDHHAQLKIITKKPVLASEDEIVHNTRARSAKLRVAEKVLI